MLFRSPEDLDFPPSAPWAGALLRRAVLEGAWLDVSTHEREEDDPLAVDFDEEEQLAMALVDSFRIWTEPAPSK